MKLSFYDIKVFFLYGIKLIYFKLDVAVIFKLNCRGARREHGSE